MRLQIQIKKQSVISSHMPKPLRTTDTCVDGRQQVSGRIVEMGAIGTDTIVIEKMFDSENHIYVCAECMLKHLNLRENVVTLT